MEQRRDKKTEEHHDWFIDNISNMCIGNGSAKWGLLLNCYKILGDGYRMHSLHVQEERGRNFWTTKERFDGLTKWTSVFVSG